MLQVKKIQVSKIKLDPTQVRRTKEPTAIEELAANIKIHGIINPIELSSDNVIITGESRFLAAKLLGFTSVPATYPKVKAEHVNGRQLAENIMRKQMTPSDIGRALKLELERRGCTRRELAKELGVHDRLVQDSLHFVDVNLPELITMADNGKVEMRTVIIVDKIKDDEVRDYMVKHIKRGKYIARTTVSGIRDYLLATKNFKFIEDLVTKSDSLTNDAFMRFVRDATPSSARQLKTNLDKGNALIMGMSDLAIRLERVPLSEVAPIHYGRLMTTYTLLMKQLTLFDKQLTLTAGNKEANEHKRLQAPA